MEDRMLEELRKLGEKTEPMVASTVRFSKATDKEIRSFCGDHPSVTRAVLLRECVERGWRALNTANAASPEES